MSWNMPMGCSQSEADDYFDSDPNGETTSDECHAPFCAVWDTERCDRCGDFYCQDHRAAGLCECCEHDIWLESLKPVSREDEDISETVGVG